MREVLIAGSAALSVVLAAPATTAAGAAVPYPGAVPSYCLQIDIGYRCTVGPFDVEAGERVEMMTGVAAPSEAGFITSARPKLVDADGEPISQHNVHLHHAVWLNPHERDMTCEAYDGSFPNHERFFASGKELTAFDLPRGHGYFWDPGVRQPYTQSAPWWELVVHLDGMHGSAEVYIELDLGFVSESEAAEMTAIEPVWLDVRNCESDPVYDVPRRGVGEVHKERWIYQMPRSGRFVFLGGHLHDGGLRLRLKNASRATRLFTSRALYEGEPGFLTGMTTWSSAKGLVVERGNRLVLTSVYDATRGVKDAMGIMVGALVPKG